MEGYIYKLISPSGKCYIGQTINMNRRLSDYRRFHHCENQSKLFNAIKKYGFDTFIHEILETVVFDSKLELQEKLNELEIAYILEYDCVKSGYNICVGGNQHRLGVKETEEQIQRKKDRWTDEMKKDQSEKWKGEANPRKNKTFGRSPNAKYINQYDINGTFLKTWDSLLDISRTHSNYAFTNISKVCNQDIKQAYGFIWRFKDETNCINIEVDLARKKRVSHKGVNAKKVYQYSKDGQFIKEFNSLTEASELHSIPTTNISKCCSGQRKTAGGYIWKSLMV